MQANLAAQLWSMLGASLNIKVKHTYDERTFIDMIRPNTWSSGNLYIGFYHPNMYSMYMMYVQDGSQNADGYIRYAQGFFLDGGVLTSFMFLNYSFETH